MRLVLIPVVLLGALACSETSAPENQGSMAFTFSGAGGGVFSASGNTPALGALPTATSWAVGFIDAGETHAAGSRPRSSGRVDLAILRIAGTTAGSASIDPACNIDGDVACTGMELLLNFNGSGDTGDFFCALTSGTIVLAEISASRAKGTFSGSGDCLPGTGGAASAFTVSNGTFDVALVTSPE